MKGTVIKLKRQSFLIIAYFLCIAHASIAQEEAINKLTQAMTDSLAYLNLTDQQKAGAQSLNKTAATSLLQIGQKAKADSNFRGKDLLQQVMGVMKQRNDALVKTLNPEQQKAFAEHGVQRLADLQTKMMDTQLDLTDEQVPQVYQVNLEATAEMMKDVQDLKDSKRKLQKMKAAKSMKSDSGKKDKALKKILNPDQYDKYEKNKEAMQAAMKEKMQEKKNGG